MRLPKNRVPELRGHRGVGNPGDDVIGVTQGQLAQRRVGIGRRAVDHMEPAVAHPAPEKTYEIAVGLHGNQLRVRPHPAKDLGSKSPHSRSVLEKDPSAGPIDFGQNMVDQEAGAGNQTPEHPGVLDEVAAEEQELRTAL